MSNLNCLHQHYFLHPNIFSSDDAVLAAFGKENALHLQPVKTSSNQIPLNKNLFKLPILPQRTHKQFKL